MANGTNGPVANPTWYGDIRGMFNPIDIAHMGSMNVDLTSYDSVKDISGHIYSMVASSQMPPNNPWTADQVATFLNWMTNGFPKGTPPPQAASLLMAEGAAAPRIRKEITEVANDPAELANLISAFNGILAKDITDPNSYFFQAAYHWLPGPVYCQHHVPSYNPWHRGFLLSFENALRSVPGCEDVTLPYWDITTPFPDVLKSAPFASYTLPEDVGGGYNQGYVTSRFDYPTIQQNLLKYDVPGDIARAMASTDWEDFHGFWSGAPYNTIIAAHDSGHNSIGPTMQDPEVASFDPVFWFFHCNWDRLLWNWQTQMQATDLNGLLSTINKQTDAQSYQIFTNQTLAAQEMNPFSSAPLSLTTVSIIDSANSLGVAYQNPAGEGDVAMNTKTKRASLASEKFSVRSDSVNVRVQGLNRLKIPGSFSVHLLKDGKVIASKGFFQPKEVEKCPTCVDNAIIHFDFELPLETVAGGQLEVWVEPADKSIVGDRFPHKLIGNPTVDVHFLVSNE